MSISYEEFLKFMKAAGLDAPSDSDAGAGGAWTGQLILPNMGALNAYTGSEPGVFIYCHTQAGLGGGWFNRVDGDTDTVADNGMSARDGLDRLWKRPADIDITPQLYGALNDAEHVDSGAIIAADTYCYANGRALKLPGGIGYLWFEETEYLWKSRRIIGEQSGVDTYGTNIIFSPNVTLEPGSQDIPADAANDMMGCMVMIDNNFLVENVNIEGRGGGSGDLVADGYITAPATLPKYSAFAPGFSAFKVAQGGIGKFRNCSSGRIKVGLYLNSSDGHIMWDDCNWSGIFGVYCKKNSGDYFMNGGGAKGGFAGIVFGTTEHAGHYGGMELSMLRVHMGFCPYPFYQVDDSPDDITGQFVGGLSGSLYSVSFEEVGEAAMQFLPLSLSGFILTRTGSAFAPPSDPAYLLPPSLVPAEGAQKYWMKLGILASLTTIQCSFDASPYTTAPNPAALFVNAIVPQAGGLGGNNSFNLDAFSSITYGANDGSTGMPAGVYSKFNEAYIALSRGTDQAYKDDFRLTKAVLPVGNLLSNPEQLGTLATGVKNNVLAANGGNWQPYQGEATLDKLANWRALSPNEFAGFTFPRGFFEELGSNPNIIKINNASGFTDCGMTVYLPAMAAEPNRLLYMSAWIAVKNPVAGNTIAARLNVGDNSGNNVYDTTEYFYEPLVWRRIRWVANRNTTGVYNKWSSDIHNMAANGALYIAGLMANWDEAAPYNPYPAPLLNGPLYLENQTTQSTVGAAGTATALPAKPTLYVVEYIGGKKYVSPRYLAS